MMTVTENINLCKIAKKKSYYFNLTRNEHSLAGAFYQTRSPLGSPCRTSEINWIVKSELSNVRGAPGIEKGRKERGRKERPL